MVNTPTWIIDLSVSGPITVKDRLRLNEPKGFRLEDPFYSDIELREIRFGVQASVTAFASTSQLARKAALLFFGQMLDTLAIQINQPLYLSLTEQRSGYTENHVVRRVVEIDEWRSAFREARLLTLTEPTFLRALGWYRKGLHTEDPFDKFLAFWNSVEIVAKKYYHKTEEETKTKDQVKQCFETLWGTCDQWPIITDDKNWIKENYKTRVDIAHGVAPINIEEVEIILAKLDIIKQVAYTFLTGWKKKQLNPEIPPELERLFGYQLNT
jgi:hypothetical protein